MSLPSHSQEKTLKEILRKGNQCHEGEDDSCLNLAHVIRPNLTFMLDKRHPFMREMCGRATRTLKLSFCAPFNRETEY